MHFELFIALRYLFSRRGGQRLIPVSSLLSILGVTIGVALLIIAMGVMNGFSNDLRDKLIGATTHGVISRQASYTQYDENLLRTISQAPGITAVTPFVYSELMLSSPTGFKGVMLHGIDPVTAPKVIGALSTLRHGDLEELNSDEGLPGIVIGTDLASHLGITVGERVNLLAPTGQQSSAGFSPRIKAFRVVGIFSLGLYQFDSSLVFVSIPAAQSVLGMPKDLVSGFEVTVDEIYNAEKIIKNIVAELGPYYYGKTWIDMNTNLFAALKLEKTVTNLLLTLIILVSSFSIIIALIMLVMEKTKDIAILMSMGATRAAIRKIFIIQGTVIGLMGTSLGLVLGLSGSVLLEKYQFIQLPRGVYSLDHIPVVLQPLDIAGTMLISIVLCYLATLYPAWKACSLNPVAALRAE